MSDAEAYVYLVTWPGVGIVKFGYAGSLRPRVSRYTSKRGGELAWSQHFDHFSDAFAAEGLIARTLREQWPSAFTSRSQAEPYLGLRGSGWTECLRIPDAEMADAIRLVEDVMARG